MQVPLSFPQDFVLWFIGTCFNIVSHHYFGNHQLTQRQFMYSSSEYKSELYKCIAEQFAEEPILQNKYQFFKEPILQNKYQFFKEPDLVRSTPDNKLPLLIGNLKNKQAMKLLERRLSNATKK